MKTKKEKFYPLKSCQVFPTRYRINYYQELYKIFVTLFLTALIVSCLTAEKADTSFLTLERIFSSKEFSPERFHRAH